MQPDVLFAGCFLLGVFLHPGFPALSRGGVAAGEGQCGDIRISDGNLLVLIFRKEANQRLVQCRSGTAVKKIAFDGGAIFAGDGDVAAIVESLLQRNANLFITGQRGDPTLQLFVLRARSEFERVRIQGNFTHARVSSSSAFEDCICTRGCAGAMGSSSNRNDPGSSYRLNSVAFTVSRNPRSEPNVSFTAEASYPLCTMQFAQRGLPDSVP